MIDQESEGSVSHWLPDLADGDSVAAQQIWNKYFSQLARFAQAKLRGMTRESDGEDIALSALKSVIIGIQQDRFPQVNDRTDLWTLLVTITARKAISEIKRQKAKKRDVSMDVPLSEVQDYLGADPNPEFAMRVADELERLVRQFDDPRLSLIAQRKLEGATHEEIAEELGCCTKTVIRKLKLIHRPSGN